MSTPLTPKISVALACYNGLPYIREQISSILIQTLPPCEIIVCDDLSTDGTWEWLQSVARDSNIPIRIQRNQEQLGPARNFAQAASMCRGEIVAFCDQDDWWSPNKLEEIGRFLQRNHQCAVVLHNIAICDAELRVRIADYFGYMRANGHSPMRFTKGCAMAARRKLVDVAFPLPAGNWMHDTRTLAVAHLMSSIGYLPDVLAKYRVHGSNHSAYVFAPRGKAGKALARIDSLALRHAGPTYRAWSMYTNRPIERNVALELGATAKHCAKMWRIDEIPSASIDARTTIRCAEQLNSRQDIIERRGVTSKLWGHTLCLVRGGYSEIGGLFGYVADLGRAFRRKCA